MTTPDDRRPLASYSSERTLEIGPLRGGETQIAVVTLDAIEQLVDAVEDLKELAKSEQEAGIVQQYDFNVSDRQQQQLHDPNNAWIDISVHNPQRNEAEELNSDVFVYVNRRNLPNPVKVRPGQIVHFNFRTAVIKALWVSCDQEGSSCQGWVIAKF